MKLAFLLLALSACKTVSVPEGSNMTAIGTNPSDDMLTASKHSRYYWEQNGRIYEGSCELGKPISWENCGKDRPDLHKSMTKKTFSKYLLKVLTSSSYAQRMYEESKVHQFYQNQIAHWEKSSNPNAKQKIEELKAAAAKAKARASSAEEAVQIILKAISSQPAEQVTVIGDGTSPEVEPFEYHLSRVFMLTPPDNVEKAVCANYEYGVTLWALLDERHDNSLDAQVACSRIGFGLPWAGKLDIRSSDNKASYETSYKCNYIGSKALLGELETIELPKKWGGGWYIWHSDSVTNHQDYQNMHGNMLLTVRFDAKNGGHICDLYQTREPDHRPYTVCQRHLHRIDHSENIPCGLEHRRL